MSAGIQVAVDRQSDNQMVLREVRSLEKKVDMLLAIIMKDKIYDQWIEEKTAAAMLGLTPRYLRRQCIDGKLAINCGVNPSGRGYRYHKPDIQRFLNENSTLPNKKSRC